MTASDGVQLYVEETGPPEAALTLVFVHGFCMTADAWAPQRRDLADLGRTICYDQRAHGRSGQSKAGHCTIEQLGDDLHRILADRVPVGPVVLIGHSMGGMTILGLAEAHPDLFGKRVIATALLSTSAGDLHRSVFGLPAVVTATVRRIVPQVAVGMCHAPSLLERVRWPGSALSRTLTRRVGFGPADVPGRTVAELETMFAHTPIPVVGAFLPTLLEHHRLAAADALRVVPTLLLVGDADIVTPLAHTRILAELLPDAHLVVERGAGHAVTMERSDVVNAHLRDLVNRVNPPRPEGR